MTANPERDSSTLQLSAMECSFLVHMAPNQNLADSVQTAFAGICNNSAINPVVEYLYTIQDLDGKPALRADETTEPAEDLGDLLYLLDKQITLDLQAARRDLLFIHGGAVTAADGRVIVLTASSGSGKSTLTWALQQHGFGYLSDELAPIDPRTLEVHAYPHALCLKKHPPKPYTLPPETLTTSRSLHVPLAASGLTGQLAAVLFVDHRHPSNHPILTPLNAARAALRLYPNTLNPLAHANDGLDAVADITRQIPCYELNTTNLQSACEAVRTLVR
jgi:hypothetical protein